MWHVRHKARLDDLESDRAVKLYLTGTEDQRHSAIANQVAQFVPSVEHCLSKITISRLLCASH